MIKCIMYIVSLVSKMLNIAKCSCTYVHLLYGHECFTGKYTTRKIYTKPHPGLEWRIFHTLTSEDIDAFGNMKFVT